ncbi:acyl-CoA dehydrogenase family protein [Mycolicibacterium pulveris]|uniref:Acyl-CoA dehydrogenase n=1 Tax=Mycolicibacterium pulveris TaxID=36813 RepID=A0A7I7US85_MYCPV|nr:acyl-CoA dehydrogenase family protein [Mycolicibacterium pulveris]MCV6983849.1 acyl-CoA dehydrogenase family protein [Mycolicibacterium pulveris]BBY83733.1 acyl-CoA dehydrogenase [Mycolicibacterium pulveris]
MTVPSSTERRELANAVRSACERLASEERVREVAFELDGRARGFDTTLWKVLCDQIGVATIALPEACGGSGYGVTALGIVAHELGRVLAPVPLVASAVLASGLLLDAGASADLLTGLSDGSRTAAAVLAGDGGLWATAAVALRAERTGDTWAVTGSARHVLNGVAADMLVVAARAEGELKLFLIETAAPGVAIEVERVLDATRPMAGISLDQAPAGLLHPRGRVEGLIERHVRRALAVLSAEQVGACERILEIATDYACTREQFGRPIGSFQAVKHRCADMLVSLEWARSASQSALRALDDDTPEANWLPSLAKAVCSEALRDAAHSNLQIHGGIGYTWESSAGLYLKRARTDEVLFGRPAQHWDLLGAEVIGASTRV